VLPRWAVRRLAGLQHSRPRGGNNKPEVGLRWRFLTPQPPLAAGRGGAKESRAWAPSRRGRLSYGVTRLRRSAAVGAWRQRWAYDAEVTPPRRRSREGQDPRPPVRMAPRLLTTASQGLRRRAAVGATRRRWAHDAEVRPPRLQRGEGKDYRGREGPDLPTLSIAPGARLVTSAPAERIDRQLRALEESNEFIRTVMDLKHPVP
jgi:hypothetical protein